MYQCHRFKPILHVSFRKNRCVAHDFLAWVSSLIFRLTPAYIGFVLFVMAWLPQLHGPFTSGRLSGMSDWGIHLFIWLYFSPVCRTISRSLCTWKSASNNSYPVEVAFRLIDILRTLHQTRWRDGIFHSPIYLSSNFDSCRVLHEHDVHGAKLRGETVDESAVHQQLWWNDRIGKGTVGLGNLLVLSAYTVDRSGARAVMGQAQMWLKWKPCNNHRLSIYHSFQWNVKHIRIRFFFGET